jgi:hypothetical protein
MRKSAQPSRRVVILEPRLIVRKTSIITELPGWKELAGE